QRRPVHSVHHHVGKEQVDRARVTLRELQGLFGVGGLEHAVTAQAKDLRREPQDERLVLDNKDRRRPADFSRSPQVSRIDGHGKKDREGRSPSELAVDLKVAATLANHPVDGGETEARSLAKPLSREERL